MMDTKYIQKDTDLGTYFQHPKWLYSITISRTAELMYVLLLDRIRISATNDSYIDAQGNVYVLYTYNSLCEMLKRKETAIKNALLELEEMHLITRKRQGIGLPNKIYVKIPVDRKKTINKTVKKLCDGQETNSQVDGNVARNNMRSNNRKSTNTGRKNRFINYVQSDWDFGWIEEMERTRVLQDVEQQRQEESEN